MTKKRIIIILFIIVFIFLVRQSQSIDEPIQGGSAAGFNKIEYKAEGLKDPFQEEKIEIKEEAEVQIETKPLPDLQIQGIVWGGAFPQAIINNKVVKIGDTIEEARIMEIKKEGITVYFGNRKHILPSPAIIKLQSSQKKPGDFNLKGGKYEK